jgi:hypothetical protein
LNVGDAECEADEYELLHGLTIQLIDNSPDTDAVIKSCDGHDKKDA